MNTILFNVKSDRIHDIKLDESTTVGQLREILHNAGYDVLQAKATVTRYRQNDTLVGQVDGYTLANGDAVSFNTTEAQTPNLDAELKELMGEYRPEGNSSHCKCGCCSNSNCEHAEDEREVFKSEDVVVTADKDGVTVRISR